MGALGDRAGRQLVGNAVSLYNSLPPPNLAVTKAGLRRLPWPAFIWPTPGYLLPEPFLWNFMVTAIVDNVEHYLPANIVPPPNSSVARSGIRCIIGRDLIGLLRRKH